MSSNDLLSYSIMNGGNKVGNLSPIQLPSITSLPTSKKIVLPPIKNLSASTSPSTKNNLTESNLLDLNNHYGLPGSGSYTYQHQTSPNAGSGYATSQPPRISHQASSSKQDLESNSVRSMSSVSDAASSVTSSPPPSSELIYDHMIPKTSSGAGTASSHISAATETGNKRRQRLGPSCDSCRSRKVKCNAEIIILANDHKSFDLTQFNLDSLQQEQLFESESIMLNDKHDSTEASWYLIISGGKLIKFKSCKSCNSKHLPCKFSKGFTKEDILVNKKNLKFKVDKSKHYKALDTSRKSSCFNCRKRKIKCSVTTTTDGKCDNCFKKNCPCNFS